MKSISARQFRASFADLTEPVMVLRRDKAGNFEVLGEWRPALLDPRVDSALIGPLGSIFRPAPKPSQAKR